jgi:phosphate transport system substrate-binding protein
MWGSNYIKDGHIGEYWEAGFKKFYPDVTFDYHLDTASSGVPALFTGVADLAPSRKITFEELLAYQRIYDADPLEIVGATGSYDVPGWAPAFGIFVNQNNPLAKLTMDEIDRVFGAARDGGWVGTSWHVEYARGKDTDIRTWGQLGLTGDWADKPIHVYGLNLRYHQATRFSDQFLKGSDKWNENLRMYANYAGPDGKLVIGANQIMQDLAKDPYGIAYSEITFKTASTKPLLIAEKVGGPYVELSMDDVQQRKYPLYSQLYFYMTDTPKHPLGALEKEYMRYILSREGQEAVVRDGKYLPLTPQVQREQLAKLK